MTLPAHVIRMQGELAGLKEMTSKLGAFILDNPIFMTLPIEERDDMNVQYGLMGQYCDVLARRVARAMKAASA